MTKGEIRSVYGKRWRLGSRSSSPFRGRRRHRRRHRGRRRPGRKRHGATRRPTWARPKRRPSWRPRRPSQRRRWHLQWRTRRPKRPTRHPTRHPSCPGGFSQEVGGRDEMLVARSRRETRARKDSRGRRSHRSSRGRRAARGGGSGGRSARAGTTVGTGEGESTLGKGRERRVVEDCARMRERGQERCCDRGKDGGKMSWLTVARDSRVSESRGEDL